MAKTLEQIIAETGKVPPEQEVLEIIKAEYPEFTKNAEQRIKDGGSVVNLLPTLESFY